MEWIITPPRTPCSRTPAIFINPLFLLLSPDLLHWQTCEAWYRLGIRNFPVAKGLVSDSMISYSVNCIFQQPQDKNGEKIATFYLTEEGCLVGCTVPRGECLDYQTASSGQPLIPACIGHKARNLRWKEGGDEKGECETVRLSGFITYESQTNSYPLLHHQFILPKQLKR